MLYHRYRLEADGAIAEARHHAADLAEPRHDRGGSEEPRRRASSICRRRSCAIAASRRCAITIPASPARRISCGSTSIGAEMERRVVLGIGNPDRGDDAVGRRVAALLQRATATSRSSNATARRRRCSTRWTALELAIFVDACVFRRAAGDGAALRRRDARRCRRRIRLRRAMASASPRRSSSRARSAICRRVCVVYAIEGESFAPGAPLSAAAEAGAAEAARLILAEFARDR